jgi:hypothetical protein
MDSPRHDAARVSAPPGGNMTFKKARRVAEDRGEQLSM